MAETDGKGRWRKSPEPSGAEAGASGDKYKLSLMPFAIPALSVGLFGYVAWSLSKDSSDLGGFVCKNGDWPCIISPLLILAVTVALAVFHRKCWKHIVLSEEESPPVINTLCLQAMFATIILAAVSILHFEAKTIDDIAIAFEKLTSPTSESESGANHSGATGGNVGRTTITANPAKQQGQPIANSGATETAPSDISVLPLLIILGIMAATVLFDALRTIGFHSSGEGQCSLQKSISSRLKVLFYQPGQPYVLLGVIGTFAGLIAILASIKLPDLFMMFDDLEERASACGPSVSRFQCLDYANSRDYHGAAKLSPAITGAMLSLSSSAVGITLAFLSHFLTDTYPEIQDEEFGAKPAREGHGGPGKRGGGQQAEQPTSPDPSTIFPKSMEINVNMNSGSNGEAKGDASKEKDDPAFATQESVSGLRREVTDLAQKVTDLSSIERDSENMKGFSKSLSDLEGKLEELNKKFTETFPHEGEVVNTKPNPPKGEVQGQKDHPEVHEDEGEHTDGQNEAASGPSDLDDTATENSTKKKNRPKKPPPTNDEE